MYHVSVHILGIIILSLLKGYFQFTQKHVKSNYHQIKIADTASQLLLMGVLLPCSYPDLQL